MECNADCELLRGLVRSYFTVQSKRGQTRHRSAFFSSNLGHKSRWNYQSFKRVVLPAVVVRQKKLPIVSILLIFYHCELHTTFLQEINPLPPQTSALAVPLGPAAVVKP